MIAAGHCCAKGGGRRKKFSRKLVAENFDAALLVRQSRNVAIFVGIDAARILFFVPCVTDRTLVAGLMRIS
jgi:hypothetical protein